MYRVLYFFVGIARSGEVRVHKCRVLRYYKTVWQGVRKTDNALVVSSSALGAKNIGELLRDFGLQHISIASGADEAEHMAAELKPDIVVINAPLCDEFGDRLAIHISRATTAGVILLCKTEHMAAIADSLEAAGVFLVGTPVKKSVMQYAVRMVSAMKNRIEMLKKENDKLQSKIEEIRMIDRAKLVLMQYLNINEESAHHYIEKQAMDLRSTKYEIAQNIIRTYCN